MKVVVLMGGYGTRMRPHSWSRPKPVMQVADNTVIGHILDRFAEVAAEEVILVVGYKGEQIESWARAHYAHLDLRFVYQHEPLGQAHALWLCRDFLDGGEVVVMLGDIVIDADFGRIAVDAAADADAVFQTMEIDNPRQFGCLTVDAGGFIDRIVEKPETGDYRLALAGVYWFRDSARLQQTLDQTLQSGRRTKGEYYLADTFQLMLERGDRIGVQPIRSIVDVGSPANRLDANRRLLQDNATHQKWPTGLSDSVVVVPPVYIHPSAVVERSIIGPYATICHDVRVHDSIIADSIIDPGAIVSDVILRDSIIGENAVVEGEALGLVVGDDSRIAMTGRR